jgi:hypothetical protein
MWIEVFKSGEHTDSNGNKKKYSLSDLDNIVTLYNNKISESNSFEAPLVKGHPGSDEPAYGWIEKLQRKGDILYAKLKEVVPELISEIRDGRFRKVSIALYDNMMLRHVGLLGAMPPAVKGLKNVAFSEADFLEINLEKELNNEYTELINYNEELKNNLNNIIYEKNKLIDELNKYKITEYIEKLNKNISINNNQKELIQSLFSEINNKETINKIMDVFISISKNNLNETYYDKIKINNNYSEFNNVNKDRLNIHLKTLEFMNSNPDLSYEDAILKINGENK